MYRKNTASQFFCFQGVDASTGGIKSGVTWTIRRCIDGTFAAATGSVTEDGTTGWYKMALSQADTNGNDISFNFTGTGAVPQTVNIITTACDPTSTAFGLSIAKTTNITGFNDIAATAIVSSGAITTSGGAVSTVSAVTGLTASNLDATISSRLASASYTAPTNLTAAQIATGIWQDTTAGDFTTSASIGKSILNGGSLGTGLTVNDLTTKTGFALTAGYDAAKTAAQAGDAMTLTGAYNAAKTASQAGDAMALTGGERTSLTGVILTTQGTESYRAKGAAPTLMQAVCELLAHMGEVSISGTTKTINGFDGVTAEETFTLDDATTPAAITRAT